MKTVERGFFGAKESSLIESASRAQEGDVVSFLAFLDDTLSEEVEVRGRRSVLTKDGDVRRKGLEFATRSEGLDDDRRDSFKERL